MLAVLALAAAASLPPIAIRVEAPAIPRYMITRVLDEASTIWRESGVRIAWRTSAEGERALRIVIDDDPGPAASGALAVGWVNFERGAPLPEIHLSRANVIEGLMRTSAARGAFGDADTIACALGRALAHELGHYLLGSAVHGSGLMAAEWTVRDLYGTERPLLHLTAADRRAVIERLSDAPLVAYR